MSQWDELDKEDLGGSLPELPEPAESGGAMAEMRLTAQEEAMLASFMGKPGSSGTSSDLLTSVRSPANEVKTEKKTEPVARTATKQESPAPRAAVQSISDAGASKKVIETLSQQPEKGFTFESELYNLDSFTAVHKKNTYRSLDIGHGGVMYRMDISIQLTNKEDVVLEEDSNTGVWISISSRRPISRMYFQFSKASIAKMGNPPTPMGISVNNNIKNQFMLTEQISKTVKIPAKSTIVINAMLVFFQMRE